MQRGVFRLRHYLQVLGAVIVPVPVDVVYYLAFLKRTAEHLFGNLPMQMPSELLAIKLPFAAAELSVVAFQTTLLRPILRRIQGVYVAVIER